jgi:hypothetical protein
MSELFPEEVGSMDSPRLAWMKRHGLETEFYPEAVGMTEDEFGNDVFPWVCRLAKPRLTSGTYCPKEIGGGETEHDAIADFAKNAGLKLWNEEP